MNAPYRILSDPLVDKASQRVIVVSDLHIGNAQSRYKECWRAVTERAASGAIDQVVINGDFTDRIPYSSPNPAAHSALLKGMLEGLLATNPKMKVTVLLGNHDNPAAYQAMLADVAAAHPARFRTGEILVLGKDSLIAHGDFKDHSPIGHIAVLESEHLSQARFQKTGYVGQPILTQRMDEGLNAFENGKYADRTHVFFGHIHPKTLSPSVSVGKKQIHITGAPMNYCPGYVLEATFQQGALRDVAPIFEEAERAEKKNDWVTKTVARRTAGDMRRAG